MTTELLVVDHLKAFYDKAEVVHGIDLRVREGELLAIAGRNGVGKTTLLHALMGLVRREGVICFDGTRIDAMPAHVISRAGVSLVPQGRRILGKLTVKQNLELGMARRARRGDLDWVTDLIPELLPILGQPGRQLSGGQQQLVAFGRAVISRPRLILMDEPFEGVAPMVVTRLQGLVASLRDEGIAGVLVDHHIPALLELSEQILVVDRGVVALSEASATFASDPTRLHALLAVGSGIEEQES